MMGGGFTLQISYDQLMLLVMGLFMFIGATRGWYHEFISSCVLAALTGILMKPELATPIIAYISSFVRIILAFVRSGFSVDLGRLAAMAKEIKVPFDADNPYMFLILVLVGFVILSYSTRGSSKSTTALGRILGGLLGLFNGFLAISLFREYVLRYFQKSAPGLWAAGPPSAVSVAVGGLPLGGLLTGRAGTLILVLLGAMVGVLLISMATGQPIGKK